MCNRWANAKIDKESFAIFKQIINISKEDMEDYHWVFTHAMYFFKERVSLKKTDSKTFFHKFIQQFVNQKFNNPWKPIINIILETSKTTLCNSN
jgi:hypothetical protein